VRPALQAGAAGVALTRGSGLDLAERRHRAAQGPAGVCQDGRRGRRAATGRGRRGDAGDGRVDEGRRWDVPVVSVLKGERSPIGRPIRADYSARRCGIFAALCMRAVAARSRRELVICRISGGATCNFGRDMTGWRRRLTNPDNDLPTDGGPDLSSYDQRYALYQDRCSSSFLHQQPLPSSRMSYIQITETVRHDVYPAVRVLQTSSVNALS
jgi:hypothetical protein